MIALGLNPAIIKENKIRIVAMEFLEAKNPLVVEKRPIKTKANTGRLINGDKNTLSTVERHENTGPSEVAIFEKKLLILKSLVKSRSMITFG